MRALAVLVFISSFAASQALGAGFSQMGYSRDAGERNRNASNLSRNAGNNSIGRGHHHMKHGHHMGAAGAPMVAMGVMQVARGMLGLMASAKAAKLSTQNNTNASNLADIPTSTPTGTTDLSGDSSGRSASGVALDSKTLHSGELGEALGDVQELFGVNAEDFAGELAKGTDPRTVFMNAPLNPLSAAEANEAMKSALQEEKEVVAEVANAGVSTAPAVAAAPAAAKPAESRTPASLSKDTSLRDSLRDKLLAGENDSLSPELQAALREQELAKSKENAEPDSLFDIVHKKYREHHLSMLPPSTI